MNKYCVIGMGFIFSRHKQAIESTGGRIVLTCDINFPKNHPDFTDWVEMYYSPRFDEVDTVVILTPNYLHSVMTREALLRGKKVICEKPFHIGTPRNMDGANAVLQLRYNPNILSLKQKKIKDVYVEAKMYRDESYWNSWKGDPIKSGGILYNLGIHYIDLLIFILGDEYEIFDFSITDKLAIGTVKFKNTMARFHIEIVSDKQEQGRKLVIDNEEIILSNQENLSYEDLHTEVYRHFLAGDGIGSKEANKAIILIEKCLKFQ